MTQVPSYPVDSILGWPVHGSDHLPAAVCNRDFYCCLAIGSAPSRTIGILLDFIRQPIGNYSPVQRIGGHIAAAGKAVFVPVVPVDGGRNREKMEVIARELRAALFQGSNVIENKQAA